ncbi:hypothetical protein H5185_08640 [Shewanella sp. SG44-6]|jgi:TusA-related sulfurtransferase|uniref:hypothetical protein n=1 Tax=Shewanella sp. SG44-6 TaxID=2760959 RepID=UPI001600B85F|nr:hypothetical protein [Shewanella sp. SG44-6]MBB1389488.1 hypothetical protein [Shewanella sp. SG44-6]
MKNNEFDLKATRCPIAMVYVRRALTLAIEQEFEGNLTIKTIEPSLLRDLSFFAGHFEGKIDIINSSQTDVTLSMKNNWIESNVAIDDELNDIKYQHNILVKISK